MDEKQLYCFLTERETHIWSYKNGRIGACVHISYADLEKFIEIVKPEYEHYPQAELQEYSFCVDLVDLLGDEIKEYKDCFDKEAWERAWRGAFKWI